MLTMVIILEKLPEEFEKGHTRKYINSHLYKHYIETGHQTLEIRDYRIIGNEYGNNWKKGKIA